MSLYPTITLKIFNKKGKELSYYRVGSRQRFLLRLQAWKKRDCHYFIRVGYSKRFKNEGEYNNKKDALHALRAFTEKSLVKEYL
uniref:Uncharacterized protein n=1 Tax=viral metagenome TaxID=1070528 RepID=A0A6H2A337_9ZZZZ